MNRFQRTRRDHTRETAEDYVEMIQSLIDEKGEARISELAARLGVSAVTVSQTVRKLAKEGLIAAEPYRSLLLTPKGAEMAAYAAERHEVVLGFLLAIGVPRQAAEHDTEGMEHHVSQETLQVMRLYLKSQKKRPE